AANELFSQAPLQHLIEHESQGVVVTESAVTVLRERRVIGYGIFQAKAAEPAVRQVQMHFFAQPTLGTDAEAVADDQHPNHQCRIDRRTARMAVVRSKVPV